MVLYKVTRDVYVLLSQGILFLGMHFLASIEINFKGGVQSSSSEEGDSEKLRARASSAKRVWTRVHDRKDTGTSPGELRATSHKNSSDATYTRCQQQNVAP